MNTEETPRMIHTDAPTSEPNTPEENPTGQDATGVVRRAWWRNPRIVAPVVALVVMVAGGGAWLGVEAYRTSRAHAAWETAATRASDAREALAKAVEQARPVIEAAKTRDIDAGELTGLVEEATKTTPTEQAQPSGRAELTQAAEELTSTAAQITALTDRLTNVTGKVEDMLITSAESKLAEAVNAAAPVLVRVDETIEDARGKVADEKTLSTARAEADALTVLILSSHQGEEFRKLYTITGEPQSGTQSSTQSGAQSGDAVAQSGGERPEWEVIEAETEAITAQYAKLDEALKAINASIGEKNKANAEAEAAKAANQAGGNTGSYTGGSYIGGGYTGGGYTGGGYSAPRNGGGGGYTAPSTGGGSAPAPTGGNGGGSAPAGGGGGFDWDDDWTASSTCDEFNNCVDHW